MGCRVMGGQGRGVQGQGGQEAPTCSSCMPPPAHPKSQPRCPAPCPMPPPSAPSPGPLVQARDPAPRPAPTPPRAAGLVVLALRRWPRPSPGGNTAAALSKKHRKKRGTERVGLAGRVLPPSAADPTIPASRPRRHSRPDPTRGAGPLGAGAGQPAQRDPSHRGWRAGLGECGVPGQHGPAAAWHGERRRGRHEGSRPHASAGVPRPCTRWGWGRHPGHGGRAGEPRWAALDGCTRCWRQGRLPWGRGARSLRWSRGRAAGACWGPWGCTERGAEGVCGRSRRWGCAGARRWGAGWVLVALGQGAGGLRVHCSRGRSAGAAFAGPSLAGLGGMSMGDPGREAWRDPATALRSCPAPLAGQVPSSVLTTFVFVTFWAVPEMGGVGVVIPGERWFWGKETPGPFPSALQ